MYSYTELKNNKSILNLFKSRENISLKCPECNKEFQKTKHAVQINFNKNRENMFCSSTCASLKRFPLKELNYCVSCNTQLTGYQIKFCSSSCAAVFNNRQRKKIYNCLFCESIILTKNNKKYCNKQCEALFKAKQKEKIVISR